MSKQRKRNEWREVGIAMLYSFVWFGFWFIVVHSFGSVK